MFRFAEQSACGREVLYESTYSVTWCGKYSAFGEPSSVKRQSRLTDEGTKDESLIALRFALICRPPAADDIFPRRGKNLIGKSLRDFRLVFEATPRTSDSTGDKLRAQRDLLPLGGNTD